MRRWLAILMLVLLPAQFSWAKLAAYCMHESGSSAWHLGHHDKAHHGHQQAAGDEATPGAPDLDCGHCHGQAVVMVSLPLQPLPAVAATAYFSLNAPNCAAPAPQPPERPQWASLA